MMLGKSYASISLIAGVVLVAGSSLHGQSASMPAQPSNGGVGLIVPVTGVADLGGFFSGALLVRSFAAQGNSIVTTGVVTGALTGNGTFRNLVFEVTLPLDVTASRAGLNTDAALAQSPCDVLHVELGSTSVNVLGSTMGLNPVAFDIASTAQSSGASSPVEQPAPVAPVEPTGPAAAPAAQPGTVTPSASANATQLPINQPAQPGAAAPTAPTPAAPQTPLASRLCSVNGFRDVSNPTQLAQQLNGVLAVLAGRQGS
jgi:hypothetical protein